MAIYLRCIYDISNLEFRKGVEGKENGPLDMVGGPLTSKLKHYS